MQKCILGFKYEFATVHTHVYSILPETLEFEPCIHHLLHLYQIAKQVLPFNTCEQPMLCLVYRVSCKYEF